MARYVPSPRRPREAAWSGVATLGPEFGSRVVAPCRLPAVAGQGLRLFALPFSAHRRSGAWQSPMIVYQTHNTRNKHQNQPKQTPQRPSNDNRGSQRLSMTIESQFNPIQGSPCSIHDIDGLTGSLVAPPRMFIDLVCGGFFETVAPKFPPT